MSRVYNFSAGPSMLPEEVLKKAAAEMLDYEGSGQSVAEMSHRSKEFETIIKDAEALLRELMNIPDNYKVLFLQGGASTQFAAIPMNFMNGSGKADFIITGQWAKKAYSEAQKYGDCKVVASSADKTFSYIPKTTKEDFRQDADYAYVCLNNTIYGTIFKEIPDTGDVTLIADISAASFQSLLMLQNSVWFTVAHRRTLLPRVLQLQLSVRTCSVTLVITAPQCLTIRFTLTTALFTTHLLATQFTSVSLFLSGLNLSVVLKQWQKETARKQKFFIISLITAKCSRVLLFLKIVRL